MEYYYDELYHYGVKGMKWGVRRRSDQPTFRQVSRKARVDGLEARKAARNSGQLNGIGAIRKGNKIQREATKASLKEQKAEAKQQKKPMSTAKKVAIGAAATAAIVGGAYGAYKLSKYVQNKRLSGAMQKANAFMENNAFYKIGQTDFANGKTISTFENRAGDRLDFGGRGSKAVGRHNAEVVSKARQMYKDSTNTKLDKGLSKVVGAGDAVGNATKKAGSAVKSGSKRAVVKVKRTGTNTKNRILDVVNPMYEYTPGTSSTTVRNINGMRVTDTVQNYRRHKVKRR